MRKMELKAGGKVIYESRFDEKTGTLVRSIEVSKDRYGNAWDGDQEFEKRFPERRFGRLPFSPSPETVDVSITDKCDFGCAYCLSEGTPILGADLTWRPIGDVSEGDVLVGFEEAPSMRRAHRKLMPSVVEAIRRIKKPAIRIVTETRELLTTGNHGWLRRASQGYRWVPADRLRVGHALSLFSEPFEPLEVTEDYQLGYLVAMSLGAGTFRYEPGWKNWWHGYPQSYWRVALKDEEALGRIVAYLASFGIESNIRPFDGGPSTRTPMKKVEIRALDKLARIHQLLCSERATPEYRRGWLAGFFDAEGSHDQNLRYSQKALGPLHMVTKFAATLGFNFEIEPLSPGAVASNARLVGTVSDRMRFLGTIQPAISRKTTDWYSTALEARPDRIVAIEKAGSLDLVDIQTSSATFFADGLATHNCYQDSRPKFDHGRPDLVETVIKGFTQPPYQVAIGGGEPTLHPDFEYILRTARALGTVPNFTTAGDDSLTDHLLSVANEVCGGVAITFHAWKGIDWFVKRYARLREALKIQINVHLIADKDVARNLHLLADHADVLGPIKLVLLAYYPDVGRATMDGLITKRVYMKDLPEAVRRAQKEGFDFAFSEGLLPYFNSRPELLVNTRYASPSEGLYSCYFDPGGRISASSFDPPWEDQPTCFEKSSQELWEAERSPYGPHGEACYGCKHSNRCATPHDFHYLMCAYAPHNKTPPKPTEADSNDAPANVYQRLRNPKL